MFYRVKHLVNYTFMYKYVFIDYIEKENSRILNYLTQVSSKTGMTVYRLRNRFKVSDILYSEFGFWSVRRVEEEKSKKK